VSNKKYTIDSVGPKTTDLLTKILALARFRVTPEVREPAARFEDFENPDLVVNFTGPDVDLLLENKAELLLALEHLTQEMLHVPVHEHAMVVFDANDYRMLRIEELRLSALTAAEKVKSSHKPFRFNPMSSRERRILHLAVRSDPAVRSESAGIGPHRGVVIYPADMPSLPDEGAPQTVPVVRRRRR
jgi:spoIIIJ-associated protein